MAKLKFPPPQQLRLSRECLNSLDEVAKDLGGVSRRAAIEIVTRFVARLKEKNRTTFSDLLIKDTEPPASNNGR